MPELSDAISRVLMQVEQVQPSGLTVSEEAAFRRDLGGALRVWLEPRVEGVTAEVGDRHSAHSISQQIGRQALRGVGELCEELTAPELKQLWTILAPAPAPAKEDQPPPDQDGADPQS